MRRGFFGTIYQFKIEATNKHIRYLRNRFQLLNEWRMKICNEIASVYESNLYNEYNYERDYFFNVWGKSIWK